MRCCTAESKGADIVRSLVSEGYYVLARSAACNTVRLRHRVNGNFMSVRVVGSQVVVLKNGRMIKKA